MAEKHENFLGDIIFSAQDILSSSKMQQASALWSKLLRHSKGHAAKVKGERLNYNRDKISSSYVFTTIAFMRHRAKCRINIFFSALTSHPLKRVVYSTRCHVRAWRCLINEMLAVIPTRCMSSSRWDSYIR